MVWFPIFATFGFILAIKFFQPYFLSDAVYLTFGRIRPSHVNGVLFGFVSSGLIGGMFWAIPRLVNTPIFSARLAKMAAIMWNGTLVGGILLILFFGQTQGREYAELPWIADVFIMLTLLLILYNILATLSRRVEKKLYVSTWYYTGTFLWFPILYFIGNVMWRPSTGAITGITDSIFNWYYGHNVLGLWFTTLGIATWYYAIPRMINRPLYSHLLSLISFFTIAFFYTGVGGHHLLQTPIPEWLKTIAVTTSVLMLVPVLTFIVNIGLTLRGSWSMFIENIPFRFIVAGFLMYFLTSLQGSLQALRSTNMYLHFSQWTVGHAHLAILGGFGFLAVGIIYWLVPKLTGIKIYSQRLMSISWWLAFVAFNIFFWAMTIAGLVANSAWWQNMHIQSVLLLLQPWYILRAMGGGMIVVAAYIFAFNVLMTFYTARENIASKPHVEKEHLKVTAVNSSKQHSSLQRKSQHTINVPIIVIGALSLFTLMTFMVVAMPYMAVSPGPSNISHPYTMQEEKGRVLYKSLGCFYCHSQFVRPQDWAIGRISEKGDYYYDSPHLLGTERTGPDLAQIGGMRPTQWHIIHDKDPRNTSPRSIMPKFEFLSEDELNSLVAYIQRLGGEDLEPANFHPAVPYEYSDKKQPYAPVMKEVVKYYDAENGTYNGSESTGLEFGSVFDDGKIIFTQKCLPCHGGSGNAQGPYARHVITQPANLHERIRTYLPEPGDAYHFWRVSEGVPGTAMPPWKLSMNETDRWKVALFEMSFATGATRTISGDFSDNEAMRFVNETNFSPPISGTWEQFESGKKLFALYCEQCHGKEGQGDGVASVLSKEGYISPVPANFTETGGDFEHYGQYVWKIREGVETTNMPPWKYVLSDDEVYRLIYYIQSFSTPDDYNTKWMQLYEDKYARNLKR
ncbi:MAG: c-type cytochrome [Candidatus Methanoperedens sp.]|nr:c-type cytochrome [Candidatus Methanoperedens sp.]